MLYTVVTSLPLPSLWRSPKTGQTHPFHLVRTPLRYYPLLNRLHDEFVTSAQNPSKTVQHCLPCRSPVLVRVQSSTPQFLQTFSNSPCLPLNLKPKALIR